MLREAGAETLVDVRRFPSSRRNPQFNQAPVAEALEQAGIAYVHAAELGGRRSGEPGEDRFTCIREAAFRAYAARMARTDWQESLAHALAGADTRVHVRRDAVAALSPPLHRRPPDCARARGRPPHPARRAEPHGLSDYAEARDGRLYLCGVEAA